MAAQRSLFEFYDSHKNPSQNNLANSKRKRLDEDIIDLNSERDGRRTWRLWRRKIEEIDVLT